MTATQLTINPTSYYEIEQGASLFLPWRIQANQWIMFTSAHTGFGKNQSLTIRLWCSKAPEGDSITGIPDSNQRWVSPMKFAQNFGFYDIMSLTLPTLNPKEPPPAWMKPVPTDFPFYLNIRNMENRRNSFFLETKTQNIR